MEKQKTIIILGAGITGLVSAYYLSQKYKVILIEKEKNIGGMSYSLNYENFILDYGPHKIYTQLPGILEEIEHVQSLIRIKKKNSIYLQESYFDFPLSIKQVATKMPSKAFSAGLDIVFKSFKKLPEDSYENFLKNRFGKTLYNLSFRDYAEKIWKSNPKELDAELAKRRIAISNIFELIKSVLFKDTEKISADFFYYASKGSKQLIDSLAQKIKENQGEIILNKPIQEINTDKNKIISVRINGKTIKSDFVLSTIPLQDLILLLKPKTTEDIKNAASELRYTDTKIIYFILNKPRISENNWIFFPEKNFLFHRISEQKSFSPETCPENKTALMVETTAELTKENIELLKKQLVDLNLFQEQDIEKIFIKQLKKAYPLYKIGFKENLNKVLDYLDTLENFLTIGRHGLFNYNNMDQCWDMAKKAAEHITAKGTKERWEELRKEFDNYKIVD